MGKDVSQADACFQREWAEYHGEAPPLAFVLRNSSQKLWLRFHALPGSKRYASEIVERLSIRARANALACEVLGNGADCWLVQCRIGEYTKPFWKPLAIEPIEGLRFPDPEDDHHWLAMVSAVRWKVGMFDDLLNEIADDETGPTLWMSRRNGALFAPYDGGFDLFPSTASEVVRLKTIYGDWLSDHPEGL